MLQVNHQEIDVYGCQSKQQFSQIVLQLNYCCNAFFNEQEN